MDLEVLREKSGDVDKNSPKVLIFVMNQDAGLKKVLNDFFRLHDAELKKHLGNVKVVVSEKRHANIASLLFQKAGFSQMKLSLRDSQRCDSRACKTRGTMNIGKSVTINGKLIRLDYRYDCSTESVIYLGICKLCDDQNHEKDFYFGKTLNSSMKRFSGHRDKFKPLKYDQSAFSMHIFEQHPDFVNEKLNNFDFGIVKHVAPMQLDRSEDYYIFQTEADIKGLNRYKAVK